MNDEFAHPSRRTVLGAISAGGVLVSGCTNLTLAQRHFQVFQQVVFGGGHSELKREDVAKYQAASISLQIGRSAPSLILLNRINGKDLIWQSSDRVLIATRGGRLMGTGGLPKNLTRTDLLTADPVDGGLLHANGAECKRVLDFQDEFGAGFEAKSRFEMAGQETLTILGAKIPAMRVTEHVRVKLLYWRHKNTYWADAKSGLVWRSRQHFHPDLSPLTITTLRPARI